MISSRYITLISVVLIFIVLVFIGVYLAGTNQNEESMYAPRVYAEHHTLTYAKEDFYTDSITGGAAKIELSEDGATSKSKNVSCEGSEVTLIAGGTYILSGTLKGNVVVDSKDSVPVHLIFKNANITSQDSPALYVKQAKKVIISTIKNTQNTLADSSKREDEALNAALYSADDLTLNGKGSLVVSGNFADGIKCNDNLKITEGTVTVSASDDGINVNDTIGMLSASLKISANGDGIKCENADDPSKGFIACEDTTFDVDAKGDGIYGSSCIYMINANCNVTLKSQETTTQNTSQKRGNKSNTTDTSVKCIKADENIEITGGTYNLISSDDCIHANGNIELSSGIFVIDSGGDGIHADENLVLNPQKVNITNSLEGIEGGFITVNGGDIHIVSSDDGINAVGKNSTSPGRPMGMHAQNVSEENVYLTVNGGNITVECGGDGLDANGAIKINDGNIRVYGPENNGNSSLDFEYGFVIEGGTILAAGSSGMAESPHTTSKQKSLVFNLEQSFAKGDTLSLKSSDGKEIISEKPAKSFNWVCISSKDIKESETYTLFVNGTKQATLTVNSVVNTYGSKGREMIR